MRDQRLYVIEDARRRVVAAAHDAGQARAAATVLIHGSPHAPERDALVVREPEEEEAAAFAERRLAPGGDAMLGAIQL